ncbi:hypothetical protein [Nocardia inohanensis]|uniref:hypothetical protein n=1 Tax=Nocardia inohanensis TaxID=209246 RepID=UPI000832A2ED|nr:hypothetical protein [Nocardia inohanensis]
MDITLEWDTHPGTGLRLASELAGVAGLADLENLQPVADPDRIGIVAARRSGELVGWAELHRGEFGTAEAEVLYAARYVRRIQLGHYDFETATGEEEAVVLALLTGAAEQARAAGLPALVWSGADTGPEGVAAGLLGAKVEEEYARLWTAEPRSWIPPERIAQAAPLDCVLQALAESSDPPGHVLAVALLDPESAGPIATITTSILGSEAYINGGEGFAYGDIEPLALAGLTGALITELHDEMPHVLVLRVFEFDDDPIRSALELAGLDISARFHRYELPL